MFLVHEKRFLQMTHSVVENESDYKLILVLLDAVHSVLKFGENARALEMQQNPFIREVEQIGLDDQIRKLEEKNPPIEV